MTIRHKKHMRGLAFADLCDELLVPLRHLVLFENKSYFPMNGHSSSNIARHMACLSFIEIDMMVPFP